MKTNPANTHYDEWHEKYLFEDDTSSVWHLFVKNNITAECTLTGKTILEIGCGRGGFSDWMAANFPTLDQIYGCDYSTSALEIANSRFGTRNGQIIWQQENIQKTTFSTNFFDTVISCETIEHVPRPDQALQELYRILKPGGILFLTCPNYFNFFGLWCVYRYVIGKPYTEGQPFVNYPLYPQLIRWIRRAGFEIKKNYTSNLVFPVRAHYHVYQKQLPRSIKWLGFRTFFILKK